MTPSRVAVLAALCGALGCSESVVDDDRGDGGSDVAANAPRAACDAGGVASEVTLRDLLASLTDLDHLTRAPSPSYTSRLTSSHDRASDDAQPGETAWFANQDWIVPSAGEETTLLDVTGPGVITRIWSANPSGTLRLYVDDDAPVIEAPMAKLLRGGVAPFTPPYAFVAGGGYNFYFPIGFRQRCRITVESDAERLYFQINHRAYADGVRVEPFSMQALDDADCERALSAQQLDAPDVAPPSAAASRYDFELSTRDEPVARHRIDAPNGGGVLRELRLSSPDLDAAMLRETILTITVDDELTVRTPLGDFFGTGPDWAKVRSFTSEVRPEDHELVARWPMPFRETLIVALEASSEARAEVQAGLVVEPRGFTSDTRLFYAYWHPPDPRDSEPSHDWNVMTLEGEGALVGNVLNVFNGNGSWWGEGDEKIYVDGEPFPSHFGTGTEDFFGYAWCSNEAFSTPFVGQSRVDPRRNYGAVSLYRFLLLDAIPFRERLVFDLEVNHWGMTPIPLAYDAVVQFYARPGARASPVAVAPDAFRVPEPTAPPPDDLGAAAYRCGG